MNIDKTLRKSRAYNEKNPSLLNPNGAGLARQGQIELEGGVNPEVVGAITTALMPLIEKAAEKAPGVVWKGLKKVGSWLKRLVGRGLMRTGGRKFYDLPSTPMKYTRDVKRFKKTNVEYFKQGGKIDIEAFLAELANNPEFVAKLTKNAKKPHKFLNSIIKHHLKKKTDS